MDQSDESSNGRKRSPYLPPPPNSLDESPEVRVPRASPLPSSLSVHIRRPPGASERQLRPPREGVGQLGRAVLALIVFGVLAAVAYWAFVSNA